LKLDRNVNLDGKGKYALLNLRTDRVEWGAVGEPDEFFVIKMKDRCAEAALRSYADEAELVGMGEWAKEVRELAARSGPNHPLCKLPD
jgi:hypothetical protein